MLESLQLSLHLAATPSENDGSRSLRRVVRIGGMRAEGSCKIGGERAEGLPCEMVMNELMDCLTKLLEKLTLENIGRIGEERADGFY